MISVLILTLNEENILPQCLESVKWSDDIVVFDSFSTDKTVEIARAAGARVIQRKFDNEKKHRTASLQVPFKHKWVYNPDADEIATPELISEMLEVTADTSRNNVAYRMRFKTFFLGKWIKHSSLYPTWFTRLFQPDKISFEREINMHYVVHGEVGELRHHFHHFTFNKGLEAWLGKHNYYSSKEAEESLKAIRSNMPSWRDFFSGDNVKRRKALKELSFRLPFRPTLRFLYMYVLKRGFLDGYAGLTYCRLLAIYEYMIVLKVRELRRREKNLSI